MSFGQEKGAQLPAVRGKPLPYLQPEHSAYTAGPKAESKKRHLPHTHKVKRGRNKIPGGLGSAAKYKAMSNAQHHKLNPSTIREKDRRWGFKGSSRVFIMREKNCNLAKKNAEYMFPIGVQFTQCKHRREDTPTLTQMQAETSDIIFWTQSGPEMKPQVQCLRGCSLREQRICSIVVVVHWAPVEQPSLVLQSRTKDLICKCFHIFQYGSFKIKLPNK